jgi:hypothetical protein
MLSKQAELEEQDGLALLERTVSHLKQKVYRQAVFSYAATPQPRLLITSKLITLT